MKRIRYTMVYYDRQYAFNTDFILVKVLCEWTHFYIQVYLLPSYVHPLNISLLRVGCFHRKYNTSLQTTNI